MLPVVPKHKFGSQGLVVLAQGLGLGTYNPKPESDIIKLIHHAIEYGVTFLDTSDVYGPHTSEIVLGKALKGGGLRDKVQVATKFGIRWINGKQDVCGDPAYVRSACEASLKRLDIDCIDLYYAHRIDTRVPIEATMGELKKLIKEGKVKYVRLSEACASTIRRAHAVHPITAVQNEWSLWSRDLEDEIVPRSLFKRIFLRSFQAAYFLELNVTGLISQPVWDSQILHKGCRVSLRRSEGGSEHLQRISKHAKVSECGAQ